MAILIDELGITPALPTKSDRGFVDVIRVL
jgi:hypothetical protein